MNRYWMVAAVALACAVSGCATGPVTGPWSYYDVKDNKERAMKRAIMRSEAPAEKKFEALKLMSLGGSAVEVADKVGPLAVAEENMTYTTGEKWSVTGANILDFITYGVVGYAGKLGVDAAGGGGDSVTTYNNSGNTTTGNDNQSNTSSSTAGGTATSTAGGGGRQDAGGTGGGASNNRRAR